MCRLLSIMCLRSEGMTYTPLSFKMVEMFTTPREHEAKVVKEILRENKIRYICREELRDTGMRYCIYTPEYEGSELVCRIIDEGLLERDM